MDLPILSGDRILFPRGTMPAQVRQELCRECVSGHSCTGPQSGGEDIYADLIAERIPIQELAARASCLKEVEG